jgi:hypothetical protein
MSNGTASRDVTLQTRVVLVSQVTGAEQWRGTLEQFIADNSDGLMLDQCSKIGDDLREYGQAHIDLGAGGMMSLRLELSEPELMAARNWLNEGHWSACAMSVIPESDAHRQHVEQAIERYYEGGLSGFRLDYHASTFASAAPACAGMEAHTPGPWIITQPDAGTLDVCVESAGVLSRIARLHVVCLADEHGGSVVANARLIAAAPELLAVLTECVVAYESHRDGQPTGHLWSDPNHIYHARAAIAKAKGGAR